MEKKLCFLLNLKPGRNKNTKLKTANDAVLRGPQFPRVFFLLLCPCRGEEAAPRLQFEKGAHCAGLFGLRPQIKNGAGGLPTGPGHKIQKTG